MLADLSGKVGLPGIVVFRPTGIQLAKIIQA